MKNHLYKFCFLLGLFSFFYGCDLIDKKNKSEDVVKSKHLFELDSNHFFHFLKDSLIVDGRIFWKYKVQNKFEAIEGFWGFKSDTLYLIYNAPNIAEPSNECTVKLPIFSKRSLEGSKFNFFMNQCSNSLWEKKVLSIEISDITVQDEDTIFEIKHSFFHMPYFPEKERSEKQRIYKISMKDGFLNFIGDSIGDVKNLDWYY
jgi:hypothetical protein